MIRIDKNHRNDACYSEWMRTANGGMAAVCCFARENDHAALYAYAYAHTVLTFFRRGGAEGTDDTGITDRKELENLLLEYCKYAGQKLDAALDISVRHPIPFISGCVSLPDGSWMTFLIGDAAVVTEKDGEKTPMSRSPLARHFLRTCRFPGKGVPAYAARLKALPVGFETVTLFPDRRDGASADSGCAECLTLRQITARQPSDAVKVYRAVVTGSRHASQGKYCQDFADVRLTRDGGLWAAVSDGAGGGHCSEYGALMNVDAFFACCEEGTPYETFGEELLRKTDAAHETLQAGKPMDAIQDYATLMGVCQKGGAFFYVHIGDGAIYGRRRDGAVECISDADNFEVSNRTYFTIEADAEDHLYKGILPGGVYDKIILMTDGVYNGYQKGDPNGEGEDERLAFIREIFRQSDREDFDDAGLAALIDTPEVLRYGDDHSAVLLDWGKEG